MPLSRLVQGNCGALLHGPLGENIQILSFCACTAEPGGSDWRGGGRAAVLSRPRLRLLSPAPGKPGLGTGDTRVRPRCGGSLVSSLSVHLKAPAGWGKGGGGLALTWTHWQRWEARPGCGAQLGLTQFYFKGGRGIGPGLSAYLGVCFRAQQGSVCHMHMMCGGVGGGNVGGCSQVREVRVAMAGAMVGARF